MVLKLRVSKENWRIECSEENRTVSGGDEFIGAIGQFWSFVQVLPESIRIQIAKVFYLVRKK